MAEEKNVREIADASVPNAGRIYDYLLGGHHNFEIDRQAANGVLQVAPHMSEFFRLIRWFLGEATRLLCDEGFDKFLDFASGLPTVDHIHNVAPEGTKVIYSDIDPVTVAYANEILGDHQNVHYVHCDAGKPEELLNSQLIEQVFGSDKKIAIGLNGIAWFLRDEEIAHYMEVLYDWADEGSKLFICDGETDVDSMTEDAHATIEMYKNMGQELFLRNHEQLLKLLGPWKIAEPGFKTLEDWLGLDTKVSTEVMKSWGSVGLNGAILMK